MNNKTVVIVGNGWGWGLAAQLLLEGYEVIESPDRIEALRTRQTAHPDLLVIGPSRDGAWDGLELARESRQRDRRLPVILISSQSSEDRAIAALRAGVTDYFKPPYTCDEVVASILRYFSDASPFPLARHRSRSSSSAQCLVGDSTPMVRIKTYLEQLSSTDSNVLITGETGTGKERVAELIHQT